MRSTQFMNTLKELRKIRNRLKKISEAEECGLCNYRLTAAMYTIDNTISYMELSNECGGELHAED